MGRILFLALGMAVASFVSADTRPVVAVAEFRNSTGRALRISGVRMADWMADQLKKTKTFDVMKPATVNEISGDARWKDGGFDPDVIASLRKQKADYVLYGAIQGYRIENFMLNDPWVHDEPQVPKVIVEFVIRMADVTGRQRDQEFVVDGDALGDRTAGFGGPPYEENDARLDIVFRQASDQAMRKAAKKLAENMERSR